MNLSFLEKKTTLGRCHPGDLVVFEHNLWVMVNRHAGSCLLREAKSRGDQLLRNLDSDTTVFVLLECAKIGRKKVRR